MSQNDLHSTPYGTLPFDASLVAHWHYNAPETQSKVQWAELGRRFLALKPLERLPYHLSASTRRDDIAFRQPVDIIPDAVTQALKREQTDQERHICGQIAGGTAFPVWLRTCYSDDAAYDSIFNDAWIGDGMGVDPGMVLDDKELYNFGPEWQRILTRLPGLTDIIRGSIVEDYEEWEKQGYFKQGQEAELTMTEASERVGVLLYLVDEEALREGLLKMKWLSSNGFCVWENKIPPDCILQMQGALAGGDSLEMAIESYTGGNAVTRGDIIRT